MNATTDQNHETGRSDATGLPRQTTTLPDGSTCVVEPVDARTSIVSRYVGDRCVWGQTFSRTFEHEAQVRHVVEKMTANPAGFHRWWLP